MAKKMTRRQVLRLGTGMTGAFVAGAGLGACGNSFGSAASAASPAYPWPYLPLNPVITAQRGYEKYRVGHCAYAVFEAVVGQMAEILGGGYRSFPFDMWRYGHAGIAGWGTACGTINGAAAAMALFYEQSNDLISSLFTWYENTLLPDFEPARPVVDEPIVTTEAQSPLCHLSVGRWIKASGHDASSPERTERCARLAGSVAARTVEILNEQYMGQFEFHGLDPQTEACLACHGPGKLNDDIKSKMDCSTCHEEN